MHGANAGRIPESHGVQSASEDVYQPEREHRNDVATGILQGPALVGHLVALGDTVLEMVLVAGLVHFLGKGPSLVRPLRRWTRGNVSWITYVRLLWRYK